MTSADDLEKLCNTIKEFQPLLKSLPAAVYDAQFNIPNWRQTGVEDIAKNIAADTNKFLTHVELLKEGELLSPDINKVILSTLAPRLHHAASVCFTAFGQRPEAAVCGRLIAQLSHLGPLLQNYTPPNKPAPNTPYRP